MSKRKKLITIIRPKPFNNLALVVKHKRTHDVNATESTDQELKVEVQNGTTTIPATSPTDSSGNCTDKIRTIRPLSMDGKTIPLIYNEPTPPLLTPKLDSIKPLLTASRPNSAKSMQRRRQRFILSCKYCNKQFAQKSKLQMHERVHTNERPFGCAECGKAFKRNSHLKKHQKTHTERRFFNSGRDDDGGGGDLTLSLEFPSMVYKSRIDEKRRAPLPLSLNHETVSAAHQQPVSDENDHNGGGGLTLHETAYCTANAFPCFQCDQCFVNADELAAHQAVVHKVFRVSGQQQQQHGSTVRVKPLAQQKQQQQQQAVVPWRQRKRRVDPNERRFGCSYCLKRFKRNAHLKKHMEVHERQRNNSSSSLLQIAAADERRFECTVCSKKFKRNSHLKNHQKIHTREVAKLRRLQAEENVDEATALRTVLAGRRNGGECLRWALVVEREFNSSRFHLG